MTDTREPPRLLDAADAAFTELEPGLRQARAQAPSGEQLARMRAALGLPAGGAPAGEQSGPGTEVPVDTSGAAGAASGAQPPAWLKLVVGGALLLGAAFGLQRVIAGDAAGDTAAPVESVQAPAMPSSSAPPPSARPSDAIAVESAPEAASQPAARRRGRPAQPHLAVEPAAPPDPATELSLLKRAKAHVRSAPQRALALVAEHEQRFARGSFAEEREVIAVEALLAAGQREPAVRRAARFAERFPESAHARRVRALLVEFAAADSDAEPSAPAHPSR